MIFTFLIFLYVLEVKANFGIEGNRIVPVMEGMQRGNLLVAKKLQIQNSKINVQQREGDSNLLHTAKTFMASRNDWLTGEEEYVKAQNKKYLVQNLKKSPSHFWTSAELQEMQQKYSDKGIKTKVNEEKHILELVKGEKQPADWTFQSAISWVTGEDLVVPKKNKKLM